MRHRCINYRLTPAGPVMPWDLERGGRVVEIKATGPLTFNEPQLMTAAALDGLGVAYLLDDQVAEHVSAGRLVRLLEAWTPLFPGYFLYYPSRRQVPPTLAALIAMLRKRG